MKKTILTLVALAILTTVSATGTSSNEAKTNATTELKSESYLTGIVYDKTTNERLAGVIITVDGKKYYSDLDGRIEIKNEKGTKLQIKASLISYQDKTMEISGNTDNFKIELNQR